MTGSSAVSRTPRLLDSITGVSGILDCPVKPGDDGWECGAFVFTTNLRIPAARCARVFAKKTTRPGKRGRRECRVPNAPAASRAKSSEAHERSHHGHTGVNPAFPAQWF